jgi:hypothetical protein
VLRRRLIAARVTALLAIMPCDSRCIVLANVAVELMTGSRCSLQEPANENKAFVVWSLALHPLWHRRERWAVCDTSHDPAIVVRMSPLVTSRQRISVRVLSDHWRMDVFAVKPVKTQAGVFDDASDPNQTFWGVWAVRTKGLPAPLRQLDVYYLGLDRQSAQFDQGTNVERRHTLGFNLKEQAGAWSFGQEGDLQLGRFGSSGLVAWKIVQGTSYSFRRVRLRPVVSIQGAISSGDANPADPRLQTFYPLSPRQISDAASPDTVLRSLARVQPGAPERESVRLRTRSWRVRVRCAIRGHCLATRA